MGHFVHLEAPAAASAFVCEPAVHTKHALVDSSLYQPAVHAVQLEAPSSFSLLVTEPGGQSKQVGCRVLA